MTHCFLHIVFFPPVHWQQEVYVLSKGRHEMEEQWIADRAVLRQLLVLHPTWTVAELATYLERSRSWVKKWRQRFREAAPEDRQVVFGQSRARHTPPPSTDALVVQRILDLRDEPPEHLQRVPGPKALLYYLPRHAEGLPQGAHLPRSTRTIWKILRTNDRIQGEHRRKPQPLDPREPLEEVQMDLKDASTVPADPTGEGKRQHVVEICNFVDAGTSTWLFAPVHQDFHAETLLEVIVQFLQTYGLPRILTFDRDPRFVGSSSGRDFPSALLRFLLCIGVEPNVCPPQRPDKNAYVERLHRTLSAECLLIHRPTTLEQVREVTVTFRQHYNTERPHQGRTCANVPPTVAFPTLPSLPPVPAMVNPDRWLERLHRRAYARKVGRDGEVVVNHETYYVPQVYARKQVVLFVNAPERTFDIWHGSELIKQVAIRGLYGERMTFERYAALMMQEARSEERRAELAKRNLRQLHLWN
jgi:hypothetical protein